MLSTDSEHLPLAVSSVVSVGMLWVGTCWKPWKGSSGGGKRSAREALETDLCVPVKATCRRDSRFNKSVAGQLLSWWFCMARECYYKY